MVRLRQAVHFFTIVSLVVSLLGTSVQVALAAPSLSFSPPSRDFGSQQLGTSSAAQTFTVTNTSNAGESIQISSVAAVNGGEYGVGTPAFFQVINGGSCTTNTVLAPTETCTVQVIFKPQAFPTTPPDPNTIPTVNGQLQIATTAGGAPFAAALTGTITSVAPTYVPASLQFGNVPVGTNAPTKIITLTNPSTSGGTLRVTKVDFVNPSLIPEFYRANDSCTDAALEPGDSCTIGVTFTPGQIGFRTDTLRFETSSPSQNAIQDIVVDGTGVASPLTVNPQGLTFTQATGTTGSPQTVTLSNNSGATVILGNPTVAIVGGVSSPFDILSTTCDAAGATLANGESCTVDVNFVAPTTAGTSTDAVAFTYQQPDGTVQVISASLTGTATAPAGAAVIVNPTSVDFGTVAAGATSGTQTVTLLNNRATPLIFGSPGVQTTGGTPADFEIVSTSCPSAGNSLAAFATCNAIVRFTPQGTTAGNRATTLRFNDGGPGGPHDVPLQGAVAASPTPTRQLSFSTQILSFGPIQAGGTTPSQTVTVTNTGNQSVTFSAAPAVTGGESTLFEIVGGSDTCGTSTLIPGASCSVAVRFVTAAATPVGNKSSSLVFADNAPLAGSTQAIALNGTVTAASPAPAPAISFNPSAVSFGTVTVGTTANRTITVTNTGAASLTVSGTSIVGGDSGNFGVANGCTAALTPGSSCTISVSFTPSAEGNRASSLQVTDNAPAANSTQVVPLNGVGVAAAVPLASANPTSIDFGNQPLNTVTAAVPVAISNGGAGNLVITGAPFLTPNGNDFEIVANGCGTGSTSLPNDGSSCTITVRARANATPGAKSAALSIPTNAPGSPLLVNLNVNVEAAAATAPFAVVSPPSVSFGPAAIGGASGTQIVTLTNQGTAALTFGGTPVALGGSDAGDFEIIAPTGCAGTLAPNASCNVTVRFRPTAANPNAGNRAANLVFTFTNNNGPQTLTAALNGQALAASPTASGFAQISPAALTFGAATLGGATSSQTVTIANTGDAPLTFGATAPTIGGGDAGDFEIVDTSTCAANGTLAPNASCQVVVRFRPTAANPNAGNRAAVLNLAFTNNAGGNSQQVALNGQATLAAAPLASTNPSSIDFGNQQVSTPGAAVPVTITNNGQGNLVFSAAPAISGGNNTQFQIVTDGCGATATLAPTQSCTVSVRFTPDATPGTKSSSLVFIDNAGSGTQLVTLTGVAVAAPAAPAPFAVVTPPTVNFGAASIGGATGTQTVTLTNQGTASLTLTSTAIGGVDAGDFAIVAPAGCADGSTLPAGSSCNVTVRFQPSGANPNPGNRAANLVFAFGNNNGPATLIAALNGQATAASPAASGLAQITPAALTFGPTPLGGATPTQTVTVTNTGNAPLTFGATGFTPAGGDAGDFEVVGTSTCAANGTLAVNASCQITVRFAPKTTNPNAGNRSSVLNITFTNNAGGNNQQVPLNGQATLAATPIASANPSTIDFGTQPVNAASAAVPVAVSNEGGGTLTITAAPTIQPNGTDFEIVTNGCGTGSTSLPNDGSACTITVRARANATPGVKSATLSIPTDAPGSPLLVNLTVTIQAAAVTAPFAVVSPPSVNFGAVAIGGASGTQIVTLSNQGTADLTLGATAVALGGTDAGDFEIIAPTGCANGATLPPNSSCSVTVRFRPTAANPNAGNRAANLVFTFANNNGPQTLTVALNGEATVAATPAAFAQITPAALSFGPGPIGRATPSQTVTITNTGNADLTFGPTAVTIAGADAGDFDLIAPATCANGGSLAPNATCQLTVRFAPKAANPTPGNRAAVINVAFTNNAGGNSQQIPLNGQALAGQAAVAAVAPTSVDFGPAAIGGASGTQTVRVTNTGTAPLTFAATPYALAGADQGEFQVVNTSSCAAGGTLAPNAFCDVVLRFAPTSANPTPGNRAATLTLNFTNAVNGNSQVVALDGQAISGGGAIVTPSSVDFGTARLGGASDAATVTVRNGGTTPLTFGPTAVALSGGDTGDFQIVNPGGCTGGATLQPGATCQVIVRFTPQAANPALGNRTTALRFTFTDNAGGNTQDVALRGSATNAATAVAEIAPASLAFGTAQISKASASQTVTIRNIGDAPLTFGATPFGISGGDAGDFEVVGTSSCPAGGTLAPNATCQIAVRFAPKAANPVAGNRVAVLNLTFTNNGGGNNQAVSLNGTATTQPTPQAQIVPTVLDFGTAQVGKVSNAQTITVTNVGDAPLTFAATPYALSGTEQGDFQIVGTPTCPAGGSLAPQATCQVVVRFAPTGANLAPGPRAAVLTFNFTNNGGSNSQAVSLNGTATQAPTPVAQITPAALTFGATPIAGASTTQTITVKNIGDASLTFGATAVAIAGTDAGDFDLIAPTTCANGGTLAPDATCQIAVRFVPKAANPTLGNRAAVVNITFTNNGGGNSQQVPLNGQATAPLTAQLTLSDNALNFGNRAVGTSETRVVTATNNGTSPLTITDVAVASTPGGGFAETGDLCQGVTLQPNQSCTVGVTFAPTATGPYTGTLTFTDNANGTTSTRVVNLSGTGVSSTLRFAPTPLDFGAVPIGNQGVQAVQLINDGSAAVTITAVNGLAAPFSIAGNSCPLPATLAPGASCVVSVRFAPTAVGGFADAVEVTLAGGAIVSGAVFGTGTAQLIPTVSITPGSLDFGFVQTGTHAAAKTLTITNSGTAPLIFGGVGVTFGGPAFAESADGCENQTIQPGQSCTVSVTFGPTATGFQTGTLTINDNAGRTDGLTTSVQTVSLTGTGVSPSFTIAPSALDFGNQQIGTTSAAQSVRLTNSTGGSLRIISADVLAAGNPSGIQFVKGGDTCAPKEIAGGASCDIAVQFRPTVGGQQNNVLRVVYVNDGGAQVAVDVLLAGVGISGTLEVTPSSLNFGNQQINIAATLGIAVRNSGPGPLQIVGVATGLGSDGAFTLTGVTCTNGRTLAGGAGCALGVNFRPTATGPATGSVVVTYNDGSGNQSITVQLGGNGTATPTPALSLSATSLDFGNVQVGQASLAQNLTITNTGTGTLTINAATLSGANAGDFQITGPTCSGATIAPNGTCVIGVIFRPTTAGVRQATILLLDNAAGAQREVVLNGVGVTGAVGLGTASFDFGNQPVGTQSAPQILTVRNTGLGALKLGPLYVGGAMVNEWVLLANTCDGATIAAGVTCQVGIAFKPTAEGDRSATLNIVDTAAGSTHVIALHGVGVPPQPRYTVTITTTAIGGTATVSPPSPYTNGQYDAGTEVTLQANPVPNYLFIGWRLNGLPVGWANPLTVTVDKDYNVEAQFVPRLNFADTQGSPYLNAIIELSSRGIIRGYGDGNFGPQDYTLRAQMAALIARAMGWDLEDHGNGFSDRDGVDGALWRNVGTLAFYGVARGYRDGTYDPTGKVLYAQPISFITRAMVAKGYWEMQEDNGGYYPNVPSESGHRQDIVTYVHYAGALPGTSQLNGSFPNWNQPSTREWFAEALWRALDSHFGVDRVP